MYSRRQPETFGRPKKRPMSWVAPTSIDVKRKRSRIVRPRTNEREPRPHPGAGVADDGRCVGGQAADSGATLEPGPSLAAPMSFTSKVLR